MRFPGIVFSIATFFVLADSAIAARQHELDDCAGSDPDRSIAVYTGIFQGRGEPAKNDAIACNNRGLAYRDKGELDRAIDDFNEAIRINPLPASTTHVNVFSNRGLAYRDNGELDRAIADFNEAIRLDPEFAVAFNSRGFTYDRKGERDRAIADYTEAIRLVPRFAVAFRNRGRAYLYAGALPKALADFSQSSELDPKNGYAALWLEIIGKRSNLPSRLQQATEKIDMTKWPAPSIHVFLGQLTPEALLAAADNHDRKTKKGQVCEANFYSGELALQQGKKDEAARLFKLAANDCPKGLIERAAASAELKALGVAP
jgi:lipoprotein NlpI